LTAESHSASVGVFGGSGLYAVPDLDTAFCRIKEYVFPYEDARLREQLGAGTRIAKTLIFDQEYLPGRTTVILVREPIGV
jgi:hypothetical protein